MKWFVVLLVLMGAYCYLLLSTTNQVLGMTQQLERQYTSAAAHADQIAGAPVNH